MVRLHMVYYKIVKFFVTKDCFYVFDKMTAYGPVSCIKSNVFFVGEQI